MANIDLDEKLEHYKNALQMFLDRVRQDRYVLAVVLNGSIDRELIWRKEALHLWIIETDGVSRRLRSDGKDERIFRNLVEDGINVHAEIIPRSRFKLMVEGSSRTAFSCNFFARRELVHCEDASIERWFDDANSVATKDQEMELLAAMTWTIHAHRHAGKLLQLKNDLELAAQEILWAAYSVAAIEIIQQGEVYEHEIIYKAIDAAPELFQVIYLDILSKPRTVELLQTALDRIDAFLVDNAEVFLKPLTRYLKKQKRVVPLSELSDNFAFSQLYPWHLESACDWMEQKGQLEKVATPFKITTKSRVDVEEPAYFY